MVFGISEKLQGCNKSLSIFWYLLVCGVYITWLKQLKLWKVPAVVGSILAIGALILCALLHSMCDLKATQMNMQYSLISGVYALQVQTRS